jgi:zinc protease
MNRARSFVLAILAASLTGLPVGGEAAHAAAFPASTFTLENGLQVAVLPNHRAPIVTQMVWYKVGSSDEPRGVSGIAHFLEHLMFKGTKDVPPGQFARIVAENGGRDNAFTTHDYTGFFENVASDRLPLVMRLEADRMTGLVLGDAVVLPERDVILEERRTRIDNSPDALLGEQIDADLYMNETYHTPTIGWESEMHRLTTADAIEFYRTWYAPNNAVLVVAGDVEPDQVRALAEKYYGPLLRHPVPAHLRLEEPPKVAATRLTMTSPRVGNVSWSRSYLAPSYQMGKTAEAYALEVLALALGGSETSRLYRALVLGKGVAIAAGVDYDPGNRGLANFVIYATPKRDVAIPAFEAATEQEIAAILQKGLDPGEIASAKKRLQAQMLFAQDSLEGTARMVGTALATGRTLDDVENWADRIGAVSAQDVNDAARDVLHDDFAVTAVLVPEANAGSEPVAPVAPHAREEVQ